MSHSTHSRQTTAFALIGLGVLFLLVQTFGFSFMGLLWPLFVAVPGLIFLYAAISGGGDRAGLAIPGAMVTGTGAILFYQNLTGHWSSWAYVWALYPVFFGLAMVFMGRRTGTREQTRVGDAFVKWGLIGFIGLWALFELFIFGGNSALVTTFIPLALIGAGIVLLIRGDQARIKFGSRKPKYSNGYHAPKRDDLQAKIDAALTEDDDEVVI